MKNYKDEYQDGITPDFWQRFISPMVIEIKGNKCEECGDSDNLDVHHKKYEDIKLSDLKVLCRKCHKDLHKKLNKKENIQ